MAGPIQFPTPFALSNTRGIVGPQGPAGASSGPQVPPWIDITKPPYNADPSGTADSTTGIQAALNAGNRIYAPSGTYLYDHLTVPGYSTFELLGEPAEFICTGEGTSFDIAQHLYSTVSIKNVAFFPNGDLIAGSKGIKINARNMCWFENLDIESFATGIDCVVANAAVVLDCTFASNRVGLSLFDGGVPGTSIPSLAVFMLGGSFLSNTTTNLILSDVQGGIISGVKSSGSPIGVSCISVVKTLFNGCNFSGATSLHFDSDSSNNDASTSSIANLVDDNGSNLPAIATAITAANTISPTSYFFHINGTTTIKTINVPPNFLTPVGQLKITAVFASTCSIGADGNIARASTASGGQAITFTWDPATSVWYY